MNDSIIHTRREFLGRGLTLVSASVTVPAFLDRTAWAIADPFDDPAVKSRPGVPDERVLVVVQLAGGNDGLNTVIPYRNDLYYKARPQIGIEKDRCLKLTDEFGLHPSARGFKELFDDGLLAIVQGVGYPNPDRSHFVATDIWSTADPDKRRHNGWLGRFLDCTCGGTDRPDPKLGLALTQDAPLALMGDKFQPVSFASPDQLSWRSPNGDATAREAFAKLNGVPDDGGPAAGAPKDEASALSYLQRIAMDARASAREIQTAAGAGGGPLRRDRPLANHRGGGQLANQLTMVRRMIAARLDTKVYYVSMGGFDTHAGQPGRQQQLLEQLGDALAGFVSGLKEDGLLDRVLILTFSEFGRRVAENASQGTDHGAAAPMFMIGKQIKPGVHSEHPSLEPSKLDRGDLMWNTDFRGVYAAVLSNWLKADARKIIGAGFKSPALFR